MGKKRFTGTGVALVTPFHKQGAIDFTSLEKLIEHTINGGVDYLVVQGTTAETATLTKEEKTAVAEFTIDIVNKRVPLMLGVGGNNTQDIVTQLRTCSYDGFDAILSVTPYYNKPQQRGLYLHYKNLSAVSPLPLIMYNVPGRTGVNMKAETVLQIAEECDNIIGIKEASGNLEQIMEIIKNRPHGFLVISGDDLLTFPQIALGADGVISVAANGYPKEFSQMVTAALKGDFEKARSLHYKLTDFIKIIFADGSPAGIKAALELKGIISNNLRLPLVKVEKNIFNQIQQSIQAIDEN